MALRRAVEGHEECIAQVLDARWCRVKTTRFQHVFANDILPEAKLALTRYRTQAALPQSPYLVESLVELVERARRGDSVFPSGIDVVTGGFPCQDFSVAGKRAGVHSRVSHMGIGAARLTADEEGILSRGMLYHWMKQTIELVRPKLFIAENVKGLVTLGDVLSVIREDFAAAAGGYLVVMPQVLNAANYGVPQGRERVIFIGFRRDALRSAVAKALEHDALPLDLSPYPLPTHSYGAVGVGLPPFVAVQEVLAGLPEPMVSDDPSQQYYSGAKYLGQRGQGQTEVQLGGASPTIRSEHHGNIEYRRLSAAHGGTHQEELAQGLPERRLTPRECALLQSFPPDYPFVIPGEKKGRFALSPSSAYKLIGNAVPPMMAYHFGRHIERIWDSYFM